MKSFFFITLLLFFLVQSCTSFPESVKDGAGDIRYKGVPLHAGSVAWSNDSSKLAVINDHSIIIIDMVSGSEDMIEEITPSFLSWAPGNDLLAVIKNGDRRKLVRINSNEGRHTYIPLNTSPISARWFNPPDDILVISLDVKSMKIGTFATYYLSRVTKYREHEFFKGEVYYPTLRSDVDITSGWMYPRIRPLHETVITPMFHKPPVIEPYTDFKTVDPVTGMENEITKFRSRRFSVPASWSPDGSRFAVTNDDGFLTIIDINDSEDARLVRLEITGFVPAWNPEGSQIYLGGWLVNSDGQVLDQMLPDAFHSIGTWSPDGGKLAIVTADNMMYVKHVSPSFIPPDRAFDSFHTLARDKLRILKDLYINGLITINEFNERKLQVLSDPERSGP
ncbi:MAG: hypothetical protein JSW20_11740 [Nitrospiraceae bacterium]|nr:MAG: hypothetical protein JSW20_11740 [Nitrospiraceae bacterium]